MRLFWAFLANTLAAGLNTGLYAETHSSASLGILVVSGTLAVFYLLLMVVRGE